jgi:hypothetical protein
MTVAFAISYSLVRLGRPRYLVFVLQTAALLHAFFRPHLAMTPCCFTNLSPPSGWIVDLHVQADVDTLGTRDKGPSAGPVVLNHSVSSSSSSSSSISPVSPSMYSMPSAS